MYKISRVHFCNGRKNWESSCGAYTPSSQENSSIFSVYVPLIFIVFRLCKSVWGAVTEIWVSPFRVLGFSSHFTLVFWVSLITFPGSLVIWWSLSYLCGFTSACYLIAGIIAALTPAFKSSSIKVSLFTAKFEIIASNFFLGISRALPGERGLEHNSFSLERSSLLRDLKI